MNEAMGMRDAMSMHLVYAILNQTKRHICFIIAHSCNGTPSCMNISILYTNAHIKY